MTLYAVERQDMKRIVPLIIIFLAFGVDWISTPVDAQETKAAVTRESKGKNCRMEQQCRWENFKKICTYVKVCR